MPTFAPYGLAIYGETAYGYPPNENVSTTFTVSPLLATQRGLYDSILLQWLLPGGNWNEQILVRSSFGVPVTPFDTDGVTVLDETENFSTFFIDSGLRSGHFYYYGLFVFSTDVNEWLFSGGGQGLCLTNWGFQEILTSYVPDWYMQQDAVLGLGTASGQGPLEQFFGLIGFETNWLRSEIETMFLFTNPQLISGSLLPLMASNYGMTYEPELGMTRSRVMVQNAVFLYKTKGTVTGIQAAASALSGWPAEVTIGPNLEIQLDDAAFDNSVGHWQPMNNGTAISAVPASSVGVVPAHATFSAPGVLQVPPGYNPVPANATIAQNNGVDGYIPPNNVNVLAATATSQYGWTQLIPTQVLPNAVYAASMAYNSNSGQLMMFGGALNGTTTPTNTTWVWNGSGWVQQAPSVSPPARWAALMTYDVANNNIVMFGGRSSSSTFLNDTWIWNGSNWSQRFPISSPSVRGYGAIAPATATVPNPGPTVLGVLVYGGLTSTNGVLGVLADIWFWSGTNWSQVNGNNGTPLWGHSLSYNSSSGKTVLFGGSGLSTYTNTTKIWNNAVSFGPAIGGVVVPSRRSLQMMTFDVTTGRHVLFGGWNGSTTFGDTWTFNDSTSTWTQLVPATSPTPSNQIAGAFAGSGKVFLFGNAEGATTWMFNGTTWAAQNTLISPIPQIGAGMAYSSSDNITVLFGGEASGAVQQNTTWAWNASSWTQLAPASSPGTRMNAVFVRDSSVSLFVLFGGLRGSTYLNDTWTFNYNTTTWSNKNPSNPPAARQLAQSAFDSTNGVTLLFGGLGTTIYRDTWTYNESTNTWAQLAPATSPSARYAGAMTFVGSGNTLLFGGSGSGGVVTNDTWIWNGSTWAQQFPQTIPPARTNASIAYSSVAGLALMVGGVAADGISILNDIWVWNGTNWIEVPSVSSPDPRAAASMVFDSSNSTFYLFGGLGTSDTFEGDTWGAVLNSYGINISTCTPSTATALGIPVSSSSSTYTLSFHVRPAVAATPTLRQFQAQIDWYSPTSTLLGSSVGSAVTESGSGWVRPRVAAAPPTGALYMGRTIKSVEFLSGDVHCIDGEQIEIAASPSPWSPPRDIWINLLPVRQNLVPDPQGFGGGFSVQVTNGTFTTSTALSYPAGIQSGYVLTATAAGNMNFASGNLLPIEESTPYTFSFYLKAATIARSIQVTVQFYDASGINVLKTVTSSVLGSEITSSFVRFSFQNMVSPIGAGMASYMIAIRSVATNEVHNLTGVLFEPSAAVGPYFDGNYASPTNDYSFEGTPNRSISDFYPSFSKRLSRLVTAIPDYIPIGATFSLYTGAQAFANVG